MRDKVKHYSVSSLSAGGRNELNEGGMGVVVVVVAVVSFLLSRDRQWTKLDLQVHHEKLPHDSSLN